LIPNKLEALLEETIESLKNRERYLDAKIRPVNERLAQIAQQKAKLADDWVQDNIDPKRFTELRRRLEQEGLRLKAVRNENDPAQLEELEQTRGILRFWQSQLEGLNWDTETEDGQKERVVDKPHKTALRIVGFEDKDITKIMNFPATKRELLDLLQVRVVVFMDRIEVKALFPIEPINCQLLRSACRLDHYPQSL